MWKTTTTEKLLHIFRRPLLLLAVDLLDHVFQRLDTGFLDALPNCRIVTHECNRLCTKNTAINPNPMRATVDPPSGRLTGVRARNSSVIAPVRSWVGSKGGATKR